MDKNEMLRSSSAQLHYRERPHDGANPSAVSTRTATGGLRKKLRLTSLVTAKELDDLLAKLPADFAQWSKRFRQKYAIVAGDSFIDNAMQRAQQIKQDFPSLLENPAYFLYKNGICLLTIPQRYFSDSHTRDGFLVHYRGIPFIVIAKDIATPRRRMFTMAHEVYHAIFAESKEVAGELPANKFAGAMLLRKKEIYRSLQLNSTQIADEQIEPVLEQLYRQYPISLECIINTLTDYGFITQEQRQQYSGKQNADKRRGLISSWRVLEKERIWDVQTLLAQFMRQAEIAMATIEKLQDTISTSGYKLSREEMNER